MKLKILFLFSLLLQVIISADAQTILKGNLKKNQTVIFFLNDFYGNELAPIVINNNEIKFELNCPTIFYEANRQQTAYLILPNEYIIVSKDKNNNTVLKIERNLKRNYQLNFFNEIIKEQGIMYGFEELKRYIKIQKNLERDSVIDERLNERLSFLNKYCIKYELDSTFKNSIVSYFNYMAIYYKIYISYAKNNNKKEVIEVGKYESFLEKSKKFHDDNLVCKSQFYRSGVFFINALLSKDTSNSKLEYVEQLKNANKYFMSYTKDYLIYRILKKNINNWDSSLQRAYTLFLEESSYQNLTTAIKEEVNFANIKNQNGSKGYSIQKINDEIVEIKDILNNEDSITYVDFWATWCKPCIEEMGFAKKLANYYINKKIRFVYVSMDVNKSAWVNFIKSNIELNSINKSFILVENFTSTFAKKNNIVSIPRYMLIGKNGKIINANAPRPSDTKLKTLIDKYLN